MSLDVMVQKKTPAARSAKKFDEKQIWINLGSLNLWFFTPKGKDMIFSISVSKYICPRRPNMCIRIFLYMYLYIYIYILLGAGVL